MTHRMIDLLRSDEVCIHPKIQKQERYPFTLQAAREFFRAFERASFDVNGKVRSLVVYSGKSVLPRHSFASGYLYAETLRELDRLQDHGRVPTPVAAIEFEVGGRTIEPEIRVTAMPSGS